MRGCTAAGSIELLAARSLALLRSLTEYEQKPFLDQASECPATKELARHTATRATHFAGAHLSPLLSLSFPLLPSIWPWVSATAHVLSLSLSLSAALILAMGVSDSACHPKVDQICMRCPRSAMESRGQGAYLWQATSLDQLRSERRGLSEQGVMCRSDDEKGLQREVPRAVCRGGPDGHQCPPGAFSPLALRRNTSSTDHKVGTVRSSSWAQYACVPLTSTGICYWTTCTLMGPRLLLATSDLRGLIGTSR